MRAFRLEGISGRFERALLWARLNRCVVRLFSVEVATQPPTTSVFYDHDLCVVSKGEAVYEMVFLETLCLEWRLICGKPDDYALFSIAAYSRDWGPEMWANFPGSITSTLIPQLARDSNTQCHFALQWSNSDWHGRNRLFLATHRGTLDECEKVLIWLALLVAPADWNWTQAGWTIKVGQSDQTMPNSTLWAHVKRDCTLLLGKETVELSDAPLRLLRVVCCHFMPFYLERVRSQNGCVRKMEDDDGSLRWSIDVPCHSYHERIEARLQLRDWLQGKVPSNELDSLL